MSIKSGKSKTPPWVHPFGVQVQRFTSLGLHPALIRSVQHARSPCDYNPEAPKCLRKPNVNNWQPWQIEHESQEYSRNCGYEHTDLLAYRRFMLGQLGPGSHDIDFALFKQAEVSPCLNQNLTKQKRFNAKERISPGPARYYVKPYSPNVPHEGPTIGCSKRFRETSKPWSIPCNRYTTKDPNSTEALLRKVISLRGPYDLFTGPRDSTNMFNKFAVAKGSSPDSYYMWPSPLDVLIKHPRNKSKGKFNKADRFLAKPIARHLLNDVCTSYKDPNWPGPAEYNIADGITAQSEQKYPFRLTCLEARPGEKWKISPGPGRYNIRPVICMSSVKKNQTSVFASKTKRTEYKTPEYNSF